MKKVNGLTYILANFLKSIDFSELMIYNQYNQFDQIVHQDESGGSTINLEVITHFKIS